MNYVHAEKNWDIHRLISLNLQDLVSADLERGKETCEIGKAIEIVNLLGMDLCMEKRGK